MFHTAYNSFETKPNGRDYIGKHSSENPYDDYRGTFKDKSFDPNAKIIMAYSKTAEGAIWFEINFHKVFSVAKNPQFANRATQTSTKFDTTGVSFHNKPHTEEAKENISVKTAEAMATPRVRENLKKANADPKTREKRRRSKLGIPRSSDLKSKLRKSILGRKMWVNKHNEIKQQHESPGPEWQRGMVWRGPLE